MPIIKMSKNALNDVYAPYLLDDRRIQIYFGGSSSGKSVFLATRCVLDVLQGRNYLVTRKVSKTIRGSCFNECIKSISRMGLKAYFEISKTDLLITSKLNDAQILFLGLDDVEKVKSITPKCGALTDIWMEEATECEYQDFKQLEKRLRGKSKHKKRLTLSFNPIYKTHWLYTNFFSCYDEQKKKLEQENLLILKTTYKDNMFLTEDDKRALESEKDAYYFNVYTLGNWGVLGDVIFKNYQIVDLKEQEKREDKFLFGLDFGFSSDPCALIKASIDKDKKVIYVYKEMSKRGLTNDLLSEQVKEMAQHNVVTCDCAEPRSIKELQMRGVQAQPAKKGADSVVHGIQFIQQHDLMVDTSCVQFKQELTLYQWKKDKEGNAISEPEDKNNHLIDALRYALERESLMRYAKTRK